MASQPQSAKTTAALLQEKINHLRNAAKVASLTGDELTAQRLNEAVKQYEAMAADSPKNEPK